MYVHTYKKRDQLQSNANTTQFNFVQVNKILRNYKDVLTEVRTIDGTIHEEILFSGLEKGFKTSEKTDQRLCDRT